MEHSTPQSQFYNSKRRGARSIAASPHTQQQQKPLPQQFLSSSPAAGSESGSVALSSASSSGDYCNSWLAGGGSADSAWGHRLLRDALGDESDGELRRELALAQVEMEDARLRRLSLAREIELGREMLERKPIAHLVEATPSEEDRRVLHQIVLNCRISRQ